jgi:hypothetical protein
LFQSSALAAGKITKPVTRAIIVVNAFTFMLEVLLRIVFFATQETLRD